MPSKKAWRTITVSQDLAVSAKSICDAPMQRAGKTDRWSALSWHHSKIINQINYRVEKPTR